MNDHSRPLPGLGGSEPLPVAEVDLDAEVGMGLRDYGDYGAITAITITRLRDYGDTP